MYGKIFDRVFTGSMFGAGPVVFSVWAYVIANAKPPGTVELNPRLLAACIGTSHEEIREAIGYLCRADQDSANTDDGGARLVHLHAYVYQVASFQKYRDMRSDEERREYMREYMRKRRKQEKLTEANDSSQLAKLAKAEAEAEAEAEKRRERGRATRSPRAQRLTIETLPAEWETYCRTKRPDLDPASAWENFRDYWTANGGTKVDWLATWRTWVRREKAGAVSGTPPDAWWKQLGNAA